MKNKLIFHGKSIEITLSKSALIQTKKLESNVLLEIQIYFSCLLVKRLAIYSDKPLYGAWQVETEEFMSLLNESLNLSDKLFVRFNTVMTKSCPVDDYIGPPPVTDFKIHRESAFVPQWLMIDYNDGRWVGNYGWSSSSKEQSNTIQIRAGAIRNDKKF